MTVSEIIDRFELYVDDTSELSEDEELALFNQVYQEVCSDRNWEHLRKTASGTVAAGGNTIALPMDFSYFADNYEYADNQQDMDSNISPKKIFIGSSRDPYQIINYADRNRYRNSNGYAYLDILNDQIVLCNAVTNSSAYEFDYISTPSTLGLTDTPTFPARFHQLFVHLMAVDHQIILQFDKAKSYLNYNQMRADKLLADLRYYNSQLNQS